MRNGSCQLLGLGNSTFHAFGTIGENNLCPIGLQQVAALHRHSLWHGQDSSIASSSCNAGQANTGIATGRLDDNRILGKLAFSLSLFNHTLGNTILDTASWVEVFQLYQNICLQIIGLDEIVGLQQWGMTDKLCNTIIYL